MPRGYRTKIYVQEKMLWCKMYRLKTLEIKEKTPVLYMAFTTSLKRQSLPLHWYEVYGRY